MALLIAGAVVAGIAGAAATVFVHPIAGFAVLLGLTAGIAIVVSTDIGLLAMIAVVYLLPFGVMPLPIGSVRLTFLDITLTVLLAVWLIRMLTKPEFPLITGPFDLPILAFVGLAAVSYILGVNSASNEIFRFFLKTINSILIFWTVLNVVRSFDSLRLATTGIILAGGGAGLIATVLHIMPDVTAESLLNALRIFNYPTGDVLRFIAETRIERAIGTAIDPNILGGMLMLTVPLIFTQLLSPERMLSKRTLWIVAVAVGAGLLLSYSRGAWLGSMGALVALGSIRYRKLWLLFVPLAILILVLPQGEIAIDRLLQGIQGQDLATQMRIGEFNDSVRLIERYPFFGVGFGNAPDIDLFRGRAAAANLYLIVAQQMGLVGLAAFLLIAMAFFWYLSRNRFGVDQPGYQAFQLGYAASIGAALLAGFVDHYFFNLDFPHTIALFWLFVGLATVTTRLGVIDRELLPRAETIETVQPPGLREREP